MRLMANPAAGDTRVVAGRRVVDAATSTTCATSVPHRRFVSSCKARQRIAAAPVYILATVLSHLLPVPCIAAPVELPQAFRYVQGGEASQQANAAVNRWLASPAVKRVAIVHLNFDAFKADAFSFDLPDSGSLQVRVTRRTTQDGSQVISAQNKNKLLDRATLVMRDKHVSGSLFLNGVLYSVLPAGEAGEHLVVRIDTNKLPDCNTKD